jgi:hypothetical protein
MGFFSIFSGRATARPHSPEPATASTDFADPPGMRITPTSGPTSSPFVAAATPFAPPLHPTATTSKPLTVYPMSAPPMRITPVNVRRSGDES